MQIQHVYFNDNKKKTVIVTVVCDFDFDGKKKSFLV